MDFGLEDLFASQISPWSSIGHFTSHNFVFFTHQTGKILITDFIREKVFYMQISMVMMEGFEVHLIYIQKPPVRSEGRVCSTVSPKLPCKSPSILNVPTLQNTACLPFLLRKITGPQLAQLVHKYVTID